MADPKRFLSWSVRAAGILIAVLGLRPAESSARVVFQPAPVIQVPNLMGYWCVDGTVPDSGGTAYDSSGNGNDGAYMAGATIMAAAPPVPAGNTKSFSFTQASHQYISIPDSPSVSVTGAFTLSAWIFPSATSTVQQGILEKYDGSTLNGYSLRLSTQNYYSFTVRNSSSSVEISTAGSSPGRAATIGAWNHIVAIYNPSASPNMLLYRNGVADGSDSQALGLDPVPPPTDGPDPLQIGKDYGGNAFNGQIDEARIYNRALSLAEADVLRTGQPMATGLIATGATGENDLTWNAPSNAGTVPVQYSVLRGTTSGVYDTVFNNIPTPSYADTTATAGTKYYYAVVAVSVMAGAASNEQSATSSPGSPTSTPSGVHRSDDGIHSFCGKSTASADALSPALLAAILASLLVLARPRRGA
jgi:hypothetical protein